MKKADFVAFTQKRVNLRLPIKKKSHDEFLRLKATIIRSFTFDHDFLEKQKKKQVLKVINTCSG